LARSRPNPGPDPLVRGMDPRIRIRIHPKNIMDPQHCHFLTVTVCSKVGWIRNGLFRIRLRFRIRLLRKFRLRLRIWLRIQILFRIRQRWSPPRQSFISFGDYNNVFVTLVKFFWKKKDFYSFYLCIWLRNCEFYQRNSFRVRATQIRIQNYLFRSRLRIRFRQKVSDPTSDPQPGL